MRRIEMPEGSKVTEAQVLRQFARNIRRAATTRGSHHVNLPYRTAWIDAWRRIRALEGGAHG